MLYFLLYCRGLWLCDDDDDKKGMLSKHFNEIFKFYGNFNRNDLSLYSMYNIYFYPYLCSISFHCSTLILLFKRGDKQPS